MRVAHLLPILSLCQFGFGQSTHLIRGFDFYYDPDTLIMVAGDSVKFQPQGIHDMVQTDSSWWALNQAVPIGGFETVIGMDTTFVIDTAGTYYFVCSPHGFNGMRGVLIVDSVLSTGVPRGRLEHALRTYPVPAGDELRWEWNGSRSAKAELRDMQGVLLRMKRITGVEYQRMDLRNLPSGTYILSVLDQAGHTLASSKVIVERPE